MTWTEKAVRDVIEKIEETKNSLERCLLCRACATEEICDVTIADVSGLLQEYGWTQALHLATDGINRLWLRNEIQEKEMKRGKIWVPWRKKRSQPHRIIKKV